MVFSGNTKNGSFLGMKMITRLRFSSDLKANLGCSAGFQGLTHGQTKKNPVLFWPPWPLPRDTFFLEFPS